MWLINSSIGRKVVMSVTGIALILFLTFHCCMNVVALFSGKAYNMICELLGANWYALVATLGLAALAVSHRVRVYPHRTEPSCAWRFTLRGNRQAREGRVGFAEHARAGYHHPAGSAASPLQLLVQHDVCRAYRYGCWPSAPRRFRLHPGHLQASCLCSAVSRLACRSVVPPRSRFLEFYADPRRKWQGMVQALAVHQRGLHQSAHARLCSSGSGFCLQLCPQPLLNRLSN